MNYNRIYNDIINRAQLRIKPDCYIERHHIIPRSMGGPDDADNLVSLTAREHFIAHWLLMKIHDNREMKAAFWCMAAVKSNNQERYRCSSRIFEIARKAHSESHSEFMTGENHPFFGKHHSDETRRKLSEARKGENSPWFGKSHSVESRQKMSEAKKGITHSIEARQKMSEAKRGENHPGYGKSSKQRGPHWEFRDELYELWLQNDKPKCKRFRTIAKNNGYPDVRYDKMVDTFLKQ